MNIQPAVENMKLGTIILADRPGISIPLKLTRVNAHITGLIASVSVSQQFDNPLDQTVELTYLFPLPHMAALVDFKIMIGSRIIQADLQEREQAREAYQQALANGQHAALVDQLRPNLLSLRVANVLKGEIIHTNLRYDEKLLLNADEIEFVYPMGITPRYQSPNLPPVKTGVNPPYASKASDFGEVEIQVIADLGFAIAAPVCPSHTITIENESERVTHIHLADRAIPDHDFVLRFPLSSEPVEMSAWCGQDSNGEVVLANWLPGKVIETGEPAAPREFVFVLDRSGSMSGEPIAQARNALRACLRILEPQDSFRILLFDHELEWFQAEALPVTSSSVQKADTYLSQIDGRGGTEIIPALDAVLSLPDSLTRMRYILFLTDGAVSAEDQALNTVRKNLKHARIFTFGIGPSVNRALLAKMSELGRGSAEFLQLDEDIEGAILRFQDKVAFPMLTDIQLEWVNCQPWDIYPTQLPDLYAGQSLQLSARFKRDTQEHQAVVRVNGAIGRQPVQYEIHLPDSEPEFPEAARLWARSRVEDLLEQGASGRQPSHSMRQEIISLAIEHHLLTPYTAFVALDSEIVNPAGKMIPLEVSQPLPKGLNWDGFMPPLHQVIPAPYVPSAAPVRFAKLMMEAPAPQSEETGGIDLSMSVTSRRSTNQSEGRVQGFASSNQPGSIPNSIEPGLDTAKSTLRWLARTQELDGSWSQGIEFTAAALLAFLRNGQTIRKGYYRKQVKRAAIWLGKVTAAGEDAYAQALTLAELGSIEQDENWVTLSHNLLKTLPSPLTPFQHAVAKVIQNPDSAKVPITYATDLDSIRLAAVVGISNPLDQNLLSNDPSGLLRVWACAISLAQ